MTEIPNELLRFVLFAPYRRGIQEIRNSVNKEHRRVIIKLHEEGFVELAGPLYDPIDHIPTGSLVVLCARNLEEAEKVVKADIYYTAGVWDLEKLNLLQLGPGVPSS